jgi:signal transduction histidine kinase
VTQGSLRVRLLLGAAIWIVAALLISGLVLVYLFEANVERSTLDDLDVLRDRLVAAVSTSPDVAAIEETLTDPRLATPFGGLYWQVENLESGEVLRSRSLWDAVLTFPTSLLTSEPSFTTLVGPEGQRLAALGGVVTITSSDVPASHLVIVAKDRAEIERSTRQFGTEMAIDLALLGLALMVAAWLQVHIGLQPLRRLAKAVEEIRTGRSERLDTEYPSEVQPLINEVNELLVARDTSLASARTRAADLAHSLKTPIAVVAATADKLRAAGDTEHADTLAELSREMTENVDYQLQLARIRPRTSATIIRTSLNAALLRAIGVLRKTHAGEAIHWRVELGADLMVDIDEHDLLELAGIVLENAVKWASSRVIVTTSTTDGFAIAEVIDDGPGLTPDQIDQIGTRGVRLRTDRPGSGFGLAIAGEIARVNEAKLSFSSRSGGLRARIALPPSQPGPSTRCHD